MLFTTTIYSQNDTIKALDEVTINGIRSTKNTPVTQKTLFRSDIQKTYQGFEVATLLNKTTNVTMYSDNGTPFGYTYFRLRGIDQTKINMTLNGVPLNEPEDQGVFFSNYPNFLDNVESVEVQRGVGTSTNGVSSFAGSINFTSPSGFEKGGNIRYTIGSFNSIKLSSTYSTGLSSKKLALYTNASIYETGGYRYNSGGKGTSLFLSGGYFGDENKLKFTGFAGSSRNEMAWQPVSETDVNLNPRTNYNATDATDDFKQIFLQLEYGKKLTSNSNLNTSVFYSGLDGVYDYVSAGTRNLFLQSNFYGVVSNFNYRGETTKIDFGVGANTYNRSHDYKFNEYYEYVENSPLNNEGTKQEFSSYLKVSQQFEKLILTLDLQERYVRFNYDGNFELNTISWRFFNPKAGLVYNFTNKSNFYFTVGQSFREPTRTNMFNGGDSPSMFNFNTGLIYGFTNVKPEKVVDYEFGVKHTSNKLALQANLFYMNFSNEILPSGGTAPNSVGNSVSAPNSFRKGVEIDFKYNITKYLTFDYNQSLTYSKFESIKINEFRYDEDNDNVELNEVQLDSGQAILTPRNIFNISLTYNKKGFLFGVTSKSQSSSYLDLSNQNKIDSFTILNSVIGYENDNYSVLLSVNNITSEKYFTNGSMIDRNFYTTDERHLFTNPLINSFLTLRYKF
jgi:iron complex outermembrane receptor protein